MVLEFDRQVKSIEALYERLSEKERENLKEAIQIIITKFDERT